MTLGSSRRGREGWRGVSTLHFVSVAALSTFTDSCRQVLGVDEYKVLEPPAEDGGQHPVSSVLPVLPDQERVRECERCAMEQCGGEYRACLDSDRCRDMLACQGKCSDPNCIARCTDRWPRSFFFDDYQACVFNNGTPSPTASQCTTACGVGDNWACAGNFQWDAWRGADVTVDVNLFDLATGDTNPLSTLSAVQISDCSDVGLPPKPPGDYGCSGGVLTDGYGTAAKVPIHRNGGVLSISGGREKHRYYPRPIARSGSLWLALMGVGVLPIVEGRTEFDPRLGIVFFNQFDCTGAWANAHALLPETSALYFDWGFFGSGYFINVPLGAGLRVTSTRPSGERASETRVLVAAGWITDVQLFPLDSTQ